MKSEEKKPRKILYTLDNIDNYRGKLYNPDLKLKYLRELGEEDNPLELERAMSNFRGFAPFERELDTDLYDMNFDDLNRWFCEKGWILSSSLSIHKWASINYIDWCTAQGLRDDSENPAKFLKKEHLSSLSYQMHYFKDLNHMTSLMDTIFEDDDYHPNIEYLMTRLICYLSWFGFSREDISLLEKTKVVGRQIITDYKTVHHIPENVMHVIHEAMNAHEYTLKTTEWDGSNQYLVFSDTKYLVRPVLTNRIKEGMPMTVDHIVALIVRLKELKRVKNITQDFTMTRMRNCGLYSSMHDWEQDSGKKIAWKNVDEWLPFIYIPTTKAVGTHGWVNIALHHYRMWEDAFYGEE